MKMIAKTAKFTPQDAETLETLAHRVGVGTMSELINLACGRMALNEGLEWQGKQAGWGDSRRFAQPAPNV